GRAQELLELGERHAFGDAERAHDAEPDALIDEPVRLTGLRVREIARDRAQALRLRLGCRGGLAFRHALSHRDSSARPRRARCERRRSRARAWSGRNPPATRAWRYRVP